MDLLFDLLGVATFVAVAGALAWVRAQRTRRILGSAAPPSTPAPRPPVAEGPDIARRLFAPPGGEAGARARAGALRGVADVDEPALLEGLRVDFVGLLGAAVPPRIVALGPALAAVRRTPEVVLAAREPVMDGVFLDEHWISARVSLEAAVRGDTEGAPPRRALERWALRRPRSGGAWEAVQLLDAETRALDEPDGNAPRYAPLPPGEAVSVALLEPMLAAGVALLRGEAPPPDAPVLPGLVAELRYRVAAGEGTVEGPAVLTEARGGPVERHGAIEVWPVFVGGYVGPRRFRERWILARRPGSAWGLWRAEER